jgi:hypothetical protein
MILIRLVPLLLLVCTSTAFSAAFSPERAARIGFSTPLLLESPLADSGRTGGGMNGIYEFVLSPRFSIGIDLAYRVFPGSRSLHQLGYGLMLKHYIATCSCEKSDFRPFVEYGLLLNVSRRSGVSGSGTAHDTRLTAGADFSFAGAPLYATLSYHYSRLQYFGTSPLNLDSVEPEIGWRHEW